MEHPVSARVLSLFLLLILCFLTLMVEYIVSMELFSVLHFK